MFDIPPDAATVVANTAPREHVNHPPMFAVIVHNDDYTHMDFVVDLLIQLFTMSPDTAVDRMFEVHEKGKTVAGVYARDVAETKCAAGNALARANDHPLLLTIEPTS